MKIFKNVAAVICIIFAILLASSLISCDNFFHNLVPPEGDRILSFTVPDQIGDAVIGDDSISFAVKQDANVYSLLPVIKVSPKASILPLSFDYLRLAFPGVDIAREAIALSMTSDVSGYVWNLIERTPDFNVPEMTIPLDFSVPVDFLVISARGEVRHYIAAIGNSRELGEPALVGLAFSKYDNPELVAGAVCEINDRNRTVNVLLKYPMELPGLSFELIPSFEIWGEKLEIDGVEIISGKDSIQFSPFFGSQNKILSVTLGDKTTDYFLSAVFAEDPDSIRSITDFRFSKLDNHDLASDAVAAIVNNDAVGTITVQIIYTGARPSYLVPSFITPGNVSVNGSPVYSGDSMDFSSPLEYRVVSQNGQFSRNYTVKVEFINFTTDAPQILTFSFPRSLNAGLVTDAVGEINHDEGLIRSVIRYGGSFSADTLTPEFTAQGLVTVSGSVQISGSSARDFSRQVKYTVTNPQNSALKRDYMVECQFVRDVSADAGISDFGFYPEDNIGLLEALPARIDHEAGRISLIAPIGSGVTTRMMIPRFSVAGQVTVEGTIQYSGYSGHIFDEPLVYTVISANGANRREYIVDVRELGTTIFVNPNATGQNNGLSWADAYNNLNAACEAATMFSPEIPKEIWIAGGIYTPGDTTDDFFQVAPNTSYIGGFAGNETAKSQRNISANKVTISGNITKRQPNDIHAAFFSRTVLLDMEDVNFEDLEFRYFMLNQKASPSFIFVPVSIRWSSRASGTVNVINCDFIDINGPCVETYNGSVHFDNVNAERVAAVYHNSKAVNETFLLTTDRIENVKIKNQITYGGSQDYDPLFVMYSGEFSASSMTLNGIDIQDCKLGVQIHGSSSSITVNGLTARNLLTVDKAGGGKGSVLEINGGRSISISNVDVAGVNNGRSFMGTVFINEPRGNILVDAVTIKNVTVGYGDQYGGAGGIAVNWANGQPAFRGGRIEIKNTRLENIDWRRLPALCIFKPEADVYLDDVYVTCKNLTASTASDNIYYSSTNCVHVSGFGSLDMNKMHVEGLDDTWTATFSTTNQNQTVEIKNSTAKNATLSTSASNGNINVNNFRSLGAGNLTVGGTDAVITVDDIITPRFSCSSSYKSLTLSNSYIDGYLYIYGNNTNTQNTNLSRVTMRDDPSVNQTLRIIIPGNLRVENSTLLLYTRTHSSYSGTAPNYSSASNYGSDIYWANNANRLSGIFNNVTFDLYTIPNINSASRNYNISSNYSNGVGNNPRVDLQFTNCTFNWRPNSNPYTALIEMNYVSGTHYLGSYWGASTLYMNNAAFNGYPADLVNFKLFRLINNCSYRILPNTKLGGTLLDTALLQSFCTNNFVIRENGANITWQ